MHWIVAALIAILVPCGSSAHAQTTPAAPAPAAPRYTTADTDIGTLLDNPDTKAVLVKFIPDMVSNPQIAMARSMTLRSVQPYAADMLTDDVLAKVDAALAKVPVK